MIILKKTRSEVKVPVTRKWYATLRHLKMYQRTKFGIPTSMKIGDMLRTRSETDGRTVRLLNDFRSSFGGIKQIKRRVAYCTTSNSYDYMSSVTAMFDQLSLRPLEQRRAVPLTDYVQPTHKVFRYCHSMTFRQFQTNMLIFPMECPSR